jgi:DNA-directed RNA polymerase subunit E'/Rpb7
MDKLYVPQVFKVRIILAANEINSKYESTVKSKLCDKYGGTCYINGYIKKSSIEVLNIETGIKEGSHLRGFITFNVEFTALFCIPKKGVSVTCIVKKFNKFGIVAYLHPMNIMIPRQLQAYDNNIDILEDIRPGDTIEVKIMEYAISKSSLFVIGVVTSKLTTPLNMLEIPIDGL